MAKPPGSTVPGSATTTRSPTPKLLAPHTIPRSVPTSTWQYRIGFLRPFSSSIASTRPTTSGPSTVDERSTTPLTSMPARTSACSSTSGSAGTSTHSRSQETGTRTSALHSESAGEPRVTFDHVPHVADPVAELERALDAHAEREARVFLRVDPTGAQHPRVDHAAAAPLDPLRAVPVPLEPHIE